jgi:hypothetical protein
MFDCNTSISGEYTLYDENMNELCKSTNLITDWGMRRFVGDRSTGAPHPADTDISQQAFVNNMRFISLGVGSTGFGSEQTTDYNLVSAIPASDYTEYNVGSTTGTTLSANPSGNLAIIFTRLTQFNMGAAFSLGGLGLTEYAINEIGCSWTTSSSFASNNRYGIFSRSTLPDPVIVRPNGRVYARYVLTIITDAGKVKENMVHFAGTGAASFPQNKTNVRDLPLFTLNSNGSPAATLNNGNAGTYGSYYCYHHPLFEDAGNHNQTYSGIGPSNDATFGPSSKRLWWLQFYTSNWNVAAGAPINGGSNPQSRFDNFTSTTITNINNTTRFEHNPCCPCVALNVAYTSVAGINYGSSVYDVALSQNLDLFTDARDAGRKFADTEDLFKVNDNVWTRRLRFLFTPNQMRQNVTVLKLYRTPLGDWGNNAGSWNCGGGGSTVHRQTILYLDSVGYHNYGIVTVFESDYIVNTSLYTGVEYLFTYSRG